MNAKSRVGMTGLELLQNTKEYLRSLLEQEVPDTVLTQAWEEFYTVYNELIRRFVVTQGMKGTDIDDCIQEVWAEAAERLVDFHRPLDRPGLRSWLYTLVRSKSADLMRKKMKQPHQQFEDAEAAAHLSVDKSSDPAARMESEWNDALAKTLLDHVKTLVSEKNFEVLKMRTMEGKSVSEVAEALDLTPEQVRYRHHRVLQRLKAQKAVFTGDNFGPLDD